MNMFLYFWSFGNRTGKKLFLILNMNNAMLFEKDTNNETKAIAQIFRSTVSTYKYYWFISILDIVVKEQRRNLTFWEIIAGMVAEAWYPIHYFRLNYGKSDSFYTQIIEIQKDLNIPIDASKNRAAITCYELTKIPIK